MINTDIRELKRRVQELELENALAKSYAEESSQTIQQMATQLAELKRRVDGI